MMQEGTFLASVSEETLMVWAVEEKESADQLLLSLGPPHHTRWLQVRDESQLISSCCPQADEEGLWDRV